MGRLSGKVTEMNAERSEYPTVEQMILRTCGEKGITPDSLPKIKRQEIEIFVRDRDKALRGIERDPDIIVLNKMAVELEGLKEGLDRDLRLHNSSVQGRETAPREGGKGRPSPLKEKAQGRGSTLENEVSVHDTEQKSLFGGLNEN